MSDTLEPHGEGPNPPKIPQIKKNSIYRLMFIYLDIVLRKANPVPAK